MKSLLDARRLLEHPRLYSWYREFAAGGRERAIFAQQYVRARPGNRILDVGCGPADLLEDLPQQVAYVGADTAPRYIADAKQRFAGRGEFYCRTLDVSFVDELGANSFDIVIAHGLIHHLDDREVLGLYEVVNRALVPGGRLVTLDGCFAENQSLLVRALLKGDRGKHVRDQQSYEALSRQAFREVKGSLRSDLHRIPYCVLIQECVK
jgi:SAM-dependent methyltransferase